MNYSVRHYSHWQGATNPGNIVGIFASQEEADAIEDQLSTCSFCRPGRTAQYSVGKCYGVYRTNREATDEIDPEDSVEIQDWLDLREEQQRAEYRQY